VRAAASDPLPPPTRVPLPGGLWRGGADGPVRELGLRAVGGEDEAFLLDTRDAGPPSARATALLARCLADAGDPEEVAGALTVGDREALLLHLRRLTLGDAVPCVLRCPSAACAERLELELRVSDLLLPPYAEARPTWELDLEERGARYAVTFRLPTAADLDAAAALARADPESGAAELRRRCVLRAEREGSPIAAGELPAGAREAVEAAMAVRDPQAELELELRCPACRAEFSVVFDTAAFFLQELDERGERLLQEVHALAWHYHWSERDILRLPARRRARYLELVADAVARTRAR
jgi:hypothetical protein